MKAVLLGAGASRGTLGKLEAPVAADFGEALYKLDPNWAGKYQHLAKVVDHLGLCRNRWALEPVWSCMDYYAKLKNAIRMKPAWGTKCAESAELKKALLEVYGSRLDKMAEALPKIGGYTLYTITRQLRTGDVLISFNYDTVAERLAHRLKKRLKSPGFKKDKKVITFAKPHGSMSWTLDLSSCPRTVTSAERNGDPILTSLTQKDVDHKREPLVLGAVPIKSELIKEVQKCMGSPEVFATIQRHWRAVVEAIRDAESLIVVGYSFPKEDEYGRFLIREGMRLRRKRKLAIKVIEFYERRDKAGERAKAIMEAFDSRVENLVFRGEVDPPN
jgi:hypothetical protein